MKNDAPASAPQGRADAETLAIQVFNFITADIDRIIQFLNVTGLQPETLRESAKTPHFLVGILDYVAKDEELLKQLHDTLGIPPQSIMVAAGHLVATPEPSRPVDKNPAPRTQLPRRSLFK